MRLTLWEYSLRFTVYIKLVSWKIDSWFQWRFNLTGTSTPKQGRDFVIVRDHDSNVTDGGSRRQAEFK